MQLASRSSSMRLFVASLLALCVCVCADPSVDGHALPEWTKWIFVVAGIIGGCVEVFYGYKLFRITLFLSGFFGVGTVVFLLVWDHAPVPWAMYLGLGLGVAFGTAAGLLAWWIPKIGVFLVGSAAGAVGGFFLNTLFLFKISPWNPTITLGVAAGVLGLAGGLLAVFMMRFIVIVSTSVIGSFMVVFAFGNCPSDPSQQFPDVFHLKDEIIDGDNLPTATYGYLAAMALLAVAGIFVQLCVTAKKEKPEEKDEWEQEVDTSEISLEALRGKKKKEKKSKKKAKKVKAEALLHDYEAGGEFYEAGGEQYYEDGSAAAYGEGGYDEYYDSEAQAVEAPAKKGKGKAAGKKSTAISW